MSETAKNRVHTVKYCVGNGCDVASGGDPVVPHAISMDLPAEEYARYNSGQPHRGTLNWRGDARALPFRDGTLDWLYSSHLLEDFFYWGPLLNEWDRVLRQGGHLIILLPDKERWAAAITRGQPPNCAHKHESYAGELSTYLKHKYDILEDRLVDSSPEDYTILFVGRKK